MGAWSEFSVGTLQLYAKYRVPYFALFLFHPDDLVIEAGDEPEEEFPYYPFIGFSTTVREALERLDQAGYNSEFFSDILAAHSESFEDEYIGMLHENSPGDLDDEAIVERAEALREIDFSPTIRRDAPPIEQYLDFLRAVVDGRRRRALNRMVVDLGSPGPIYDENSLFSSRGILDRDELWGLPLSSCPYVPRGVVEVAYQLLSICDEYGDFYELLLAWILLSIGRGDGHTKINISQLIEPPNVEQGALEMLSEVRSGAIRKLDAYNRAFSILAMRDPQLAETARREKILAQLREAIHQVEAYSKGKLLEDSISSLFSSSDQFEIGSKRLNLEDEELDIVLHNNSPRPFFLGLQSPLILVECKNWTVSVGAAEVRNFEGKIRNHANLCRVGLFIAVNGFTEPVFEFLRRLGRDSPVLVAIELDQIESYLAGSQMLDEWLQDRIAESLV